MNSSSLQCASSVSMSSKHGCKKETSAMIQSRRAEFFANYKRQEFSLPDSIMFYMAMNPPSSEAYQKMIKTCKYIYVKNPVLVIPQFNYHGDGECYLSLKQRRINLSKVTSKIWITEQLFVEARTITQNILSSVMPKIYQCDAEFVYISNQNISFHDLSLLVSSAERIDFFNITIKDEDDLNVALENIVEVAVKAKEITIFNQSNKSFLSVTSNTMKELIQIPHFSKLDELKLNCVPETFDLETFYGYLKQNKTTKFSLRFHASISQAFKNRLEEIVDEILATENRDYLIPRIDFSEFDVVKWRKLDRVFSSYYKSV